MKTKKYLLISLLLILILAACSSGGDGDDPKKPVKDFFNALADMDGGKAAKTICKQYRGDFETSVGELFDMLKSLDDDAKIEIIDMKLEVKNKTDDKAEVIATGGTMKMTMLGQTEVTDLADEATKEPLGVVKEDGKWLICDDSFLEGFGE